MEPQAGFVRLCISGTPKKDIAHDTLLPRAMKTIEEGIRMLEPKKQLTHIAQAAQQFEASGMQVHS